MSKTTDIIRNVDLEPQALKIYKSHVDESYAELQSGEEVTTTNVLTRLLHLCQLTGCFLGNDETSAVDQVSNAKLSVLEDLVDSFLQEGKMLVVIARFMPGFHAICKILGKNGRVWTEDNTSLVTDMTEEEQEKVKVWIHENILLRKTPLFTRSSYGIKHLFERDTKIYMTNNQFNDVILLCGFYPVDEHLLNCNYCIGKKLPAFKRKV